MIRRPPRPPLFPSTPLSRPHVPEPPRVPRQQRIVEPHRAPILPHLRDRVSAGAQPDVPLERERVSGGGPGEGERDEGDAQEDRKSTRLNSSHSQISYAVFCL